MCKFNEECLQTTEHGAVEGNLFRRLNKEDGHPTPQNTSTFEEQFLTHTTSPCCLVHLAHLSLKNDERENYQQYNQIVANRNYDQTHTVAFGG